MHLARARTTVQVGQARDGEEAVRTASELSPDMVVMDVTLPNKHGVEACGEIMEFAPDKRVVMLTASTEDDAVIEAVAAGATGYLQKVSGMHRLLDTVREVAAWKLRVLAEVVKRVFGGVCGRRSWGPGDLTRRQREILARFCRGLSCARTAEARAGSSR